MMNRFTVLIAVIAANLTLAPIPSTAGNKAALTRLTPAALAPTKMGLLSPMVLGRSACCRRGQLSLAQRQRAL
jgi:hypothetical protein